MNDNPNPSLQNNEPSSTNPKPTSPDYHKAEATIALSWKALFSHFHLNDAPNLSNLNTIAAIIYKLSSAHTQYASLKLKSKELSMKEYSHKLKNNPLPPQNTPVSLSPEILSQIEQQLKLL